MEQRNQVLSGSDVERICDHMNAEHADDLLRFAKVFGSTPEATSARMIGIDSAGVDLEALRADETVSIRIEFDTPLRTPDDARRSLVDMAMEAREKQGGHDDAS